MLSYYQIVTLSYYCIIILSYYNISYMIISHTYISNGQVQENVIISSKSAVINATSPSNTVLFCQDWLDPNSLFTSWPLDIWVKQTWLCLKFGSIYIAQYGQSCSRDNAHWPVDSGVLYVQTNACPYLKLSYLGAALQHDSTLHHHFFLWSNILSKHTIDVISLTTNIVGTCHFMYV